MSSAASSKPLDLAYISGLVFDQIVGTTQAMVSPGMEDLVMVRKPLEASAPRISASGLIEDEPAEFMEGHALSQQTIREAQEKEKALTNETLLAIAPKLVIDEAKLSVTLQVENRDKIQALMAELVNARVARDAAAGEEVFTRLSTHLKPEVTLEQIGALITTAIAREESRLSSQTGVAGVYRFAPRPNTRARGASVPDPDTFGEVLALIAGTTQRKMDAIAFHARQAAPANPTVGSSFISSDAGRVSATRLMPEHLAGTEEPIEGVETYTKGVETAIAEVDKVSFLGNPPSIEIDAVNGSVKVTIPNLSRIAAALETMIAARRDNDEERLSVTYVQFARFINPKFRSTDVIAVIDRVLDQEKAREELPRTQAGFLKFAERPVTETSRTT